jgi:hypothetical protein
MIIVRYIPKGKMDNVPDFYAASRKSLPSAVNGIAELAHEGLETTIKGCQYCEFNTREKRVGVVDGWKPLGDLVVVNCGLAPQVDEEEEEE